MLSSEEMVSRLAKYLLQMQNGERLQSVREIAKLNNTSVGTVSNALSSLESSGAVKVNRRGHLGAFLESRSIGELWSIAEKEPMVVSFPLIAHTRLEGLATGLKSQLRQAGIDVYLIFIRGSRTRLKAVRENKCHIAVMSDYAAARLGSDTEQLLLRFPAQSYVTSHEVFYRSRLTDAENPQRVAMDRDSFDIEGLTEIEFMDQEVEFKPMTFMQLPRLLKNNTVDAGIWSIDDMSPHLDDEILHRPLSDHVIEHIGEANTSAALIARAENTSVRSVVETVLDVPTIMAIQQKVITGEMVPEY